MSVTACLDAPVGPGTGQRHDIALVQALLGQVPDRSGGPYWTGRLDGRPSDALDDAVNRFQEDFGLLDDPGDDIRAVIDPASVTYQCLREAAPPSLSGLRAIAGTATLYIPPRGGTRVLSAMTAKLRGIGFAGSPAFGRSLAVLAERIYDRHRLLVRFPLQSHDDALGSGSIRARVALHGLKWLTEHGVLTSSEAPASPVPDAIWTLVAAEAGGLRQLVPELLDCAGSRTLWLRHDG